MILSWLKKLKISGNKRLEALLDFYEKDHNDPFILYALALEYMAENDFGKAEEFFDQLLKKDPDYIAGYLQYARLMEKTDKINEAKELYTRGIEAAKKSGDKKAEKEMEDFLDELN